MKSIIVYYSQTGNTKTIAQAIHQGLSQSINRSEIVKMKEADIKRLSDYDLVGFGSPVWGGVPPNVKLFIDELPAMHGKLAFAFSTHASLGQRFFEVIKLLKNKGFTIIGIRDWYASAYRPALPKPYLTDGHPDEIDIREAVNFGNEMAEVSHKILSGESTFIPKMPSIPKMPPRNKNVSPIPKFDKQKCRYPECRLCVDNCPMEGINLSVTPPIFAKPCRSCYFCELICPTGAIEVDYEPLAKASFERMKEVFVPHLAQAEAEGSFRRLVPFEKVGWDTPYYKVYNKHPRYVIPPE